MLRMIEQSIIRTSNLSIQLEQSIIESLYLDSILVLQLSMVLVPNYSETSMEGCPQYRGFLSMEGPDREVLLDSAAFFLAHDLLLVLCVLDEVRVRSRRRGPVVRPPPASPPPRPAPTTRWGRGRPEGGKPLAPPRGNTPSGRPRRD